VLTRHAIQRQIPRLPTPPSNGIGSEEDSIQNCRMLRPKPARKDMAKYKKYAGKVRAPPYPASQTDDVQVHLTSCGAPPRVMVRSCAVPCFPMASPSLKACLHGGVMVTVQASKILLGSTHICVRRRHEHMLTAAEKMGSTVLRQSPIHSTNGGKYSNLWHEYR
jgi:hypothetical protein